MRGGHTVFEYYGSGADYAWNDPLGDIDFGHGTPHDIRSVTKSVTALLYGIALGDGLVPPPDEPLLRRFPEYPDLAAHPERARLTVEHALTMSLGVEWDEGAPYHSPANAEIAMELAPDRYRYILERPIVAPPRTQWTYCGGATALLGRLIADGAGRSLPRYGRDVLFRPLGVDTVEWSPARTG